MPLLPVSLERGEDLRLHARIQQRKEAKLIWLVEVEAKSCRVEGTSQQACQPAHEPTNPSSVYVVSAYFLWSLAKTWDGPAISLLKKLSRRRRHCLRAYFRDAL